MMIKSPILFFLVLWSLSLLFPLTADLKRGKELYLKHCASCHGENGDGKGVAAYLLSPKPRDFTAGLYKFRSRPSGSPPTDEDLLRTLKRGIPGVGMPAWDRLPENDLLALVEYLKSLSDSFEDEEVEPVISIPKEPPYTPESILEGKKVYEMMRCAECHGTTGLGDGPAARGLKDSQGFPIIPYNFTKGTHLMKSGPYREDIYRTFMTGLDGTPMPSYGFLADMDGNMGWHLVHYIFSLSASSSRPPLLETPTLKASSVSLDPTLSPTDPVWSDTPSISVPLRPLWKNDNFCDRIQIQTVLSPQWVTFRLQWEDSTKNEEVVQTTQFRDAVALQLVPQGNPKDYLGLPFIGMGDATKAVSIWHWKADWEKDLLGTYQDSVEKYKVQFNSVKPITYSSGSEAQNKLSQRNRKSSVEALVAKGFGTLTSLPQEQQTLWGKGVWENGIWTVIIQAPRSLLPNNSESASFPIAVAVWDGSVGDRNGQKNVSQWMELMLK